MSAATGVEQVDAAVIWCAALVAVTGAVTVVWRATRAARRLARRVDEFVDDWQGTEARPGVPGRPGVMARLVDIEQQIAGTAEQLAAVEHELHPNSGSSLRDAVDRVDERTRQIVDDPPP
ncbi:hypothetical protein GCM10010329_17460 [Streptomyces spiroverticillatus]|uniref:Uncharacterized protein n=1 Tax=Streptomyces finlayi TaxID=67296 RepID=A0A919C7L8_9ACTN|nr:hypothetical protein [Streptomyces finlayi]GGZ96738.1 hypothetical protein GCM10010329_17460 [Streptomyces spiroverticillatus]GHC82035.1 hypothetical protein GCM10010334_09940 [Streptomyces finlayi]